MNCLRMVVLSTISLVVIGPILCFVPACSIATRTINVAKLGPANQIEVHERGKPMFEHPITAGSTEDQAVQSWLRLHSTGWEHSLASYVPSRRVKGENFDLNFLGNSCVLNYRVNDKGEWTQVIRPTKEDDPILNVFAPGQALK